MPFTISLRSYPMPFDDIIKIIKILCVFFFLTQSLRYHMFFYDVIAIISLNFIEISYADLPYH